jgi:hypothetical protein
MYTVPRGMPSFFMCQIGFRLTQMLVNTLVAQLFAALQVQRPDGCRGWKCCSCPAEKRVPSEPPPLSHAIARSRSRDQCRSAISTCLDPLRMKIWLLQRKHVIKVPENINARTHAAFTASTSTARATV